ncbi:hypothetical protein C5167_002880 [Papaver somniferum]|uniref:Uncharacterized protein n=1 Tax=Papaver somniferum TaxID=3469 RepID=A0A4Y7KZE4_PAPSO|nr:hypothetical protein C5167_002880 [Papaver somniferum]
MGSSAESSNSKGTKREFSTPINFGLCLFRSYIEMQRKFCSDGKTWKGDGLVVNRLRVVLSICSMFFT